MILANKEPYRLSKDLCKLEVDKGCLFSYDIPFLSFSRIDIDGKRKVVACIFGRYTLSL